MRSSTSTGATSGGERALTSAEKAAARKKAKYALTRAALHTNKAVLLDKTWAGTLTTSPPSASASGKLTWMPTALISAISPYVHRPVVNELEISTWRSFHPRNLPSLDGNSLLPPSSSDAASLPSSVGASAFPPSLAVESPVPASVTGDMDNDMDTSICVR